jgi:hypothetical protein
VGEEEDPPRQPARVNVDNNAINIKNFFIMFLVLK